MKMEIKPAKYWTRNRGATKQVKKINAFRGAFGFLSNFFPCHVTLDGLAFQTVEHAFVAAKTMSTIHRMIIQKLPTPGKAKRYEARIKAREGWEEMKLQVMEDLLRQKFSPGSELAEALVATGEAKLLEGNNRGDTFWGVRIGCGMGHNHLGKLLMKIRSDLVTEQEGEPVCTKS